METLIKTAADEYGVPSYDINALLGISDPCGLTREERIPLAARVLKDFGTRLPLEQKRKEMEYLSQRYFEKYATTRVIRKTERKASETLEPVQEPEEERERDFRERQFKD